MMPAIYNVADSFIVTMMIGVALLVLFGLGLDGRRERRAAAETDDDLDGSAEGALDPAPGGASDGMPGAAVLLDEAPVETSIDSRESAARDASASADEAPGAAAKD